MTNEELTRLQRTQYEILKNIREVCEKFNIRYYLFYGTLLGAVRHQGSIPWDCDIDICMDEDNFRKFEAHASDLSDLYELRAVGGPWGGLSRVYKKNTLLYSPAHGREHAFPIHIDIFKLEYEKAHGALHTRIEKALARYFMIGKISRYEKGWLYERFRNQPLKLLIVKSGDFFRLFASEEAMEKWAHRLVISDRRTNRYTLMQDFHASYPVEWFGNGRMIRYEDQLFNTPDETDRILTRTYGNYMEFPPEEERFTHDMDSFAVEF